MINCGSRPDRKYWACHSFLLGLSDAKTVDGQAGWETGMGALVAALAVRTHLRSGMLNLRAVRVWKNSSWITRSAAWLSEWSEVSRPGEIGLGGDLYGDIYAGSHFLTSEGDAAVVREELHQAGSVIDRDTYDAWMSRGKERLGSGLREVERVMSSHIVEPLPDDSLQALMSIMEDDARRLGITLPFGF